MKNTNLKILLSPLFLLGLFLLLFNDFYLKAEFHNFFTGKLSDFAGLFIFPLFWSAFFPKRKLGIYIFTAIFFIFWKSPFSQDLIYFINEFRLLIIGRIVDFTDLFALIILPFSYLYSYFQTPNSKTFIQPHYIQKIAATIVILFSVFVFSATSRVRDRSINSFKTYQIRMNPQEIEQVLRTTKYVSNIKFLKESSEQNTSQNTLPSIPSNTYIVKFDLKYKICDEDNVEFSFILKEESTFSEVFSMSAHYECGFYEDTAINRDILSENQTEELKNVFESLFIDKLQLMPQPKIINKNE